MPLFSAETRINFDLEVPDPVWDEWESYKAFKGGDRYALPKDYLNYPKRDLVAVDPTGPWCDPVKVAPLSEAILQWDFRNRRLITVLYIKGSHESGFTFNNTNPWSRQAESVAVRNIDLAGRGGGVEVNPVIHIPNSLIGDQARTLGSEYRDAVISKNRDAKVWIGRKMREQFGLVVGMVGANGPYFKLCEPY